MPPKGGRALGPSAGQQQQQGYMRNTMNALTDAENRTVVIAVSFFAVSDPVDLRRRMLGMLEDMDFHGEAWE